MASTPRISYATDGHVALIGLQRPEKRNAFDRAMLEELAKAYTRFEDDGSLRCALLFAHGGHFTGGLDLASVGPEVAAGAAIFDAADVDPLDVGPRRRTKPIVAAIQGYCFTLGIELALAADVRLAADDAKFTQLEVKRAFLPFGNATLRFPQVAGWGNAMRWMLTGDLFDASEALRMGLVQEVVPAAELQARALGLASRIAAQAPLAVQAILASSRAAIDDGPAVEAGRLHARARTLMATEDAAEGMRAFLERREGTFQGR
jgi:enoyl-CoA hydratase/carnithine racemase